MKTLKYILTLLLPFWLLLAISLYWFAGLITADVELFLSGATPELAAATHSHITMGLGLIIVLISICFVVTMLTHWRASVKLIELKTLFRAAPCGILTIDSKGRVRKANNQAMQLFGIARGQTKQLHIDQLLPLELQFAQTKISQSLVDEVGVADLNNMSSQFFARKLNGDEFPINLSVSNPEPLSSLSCFINSSTKLLTFSFCFFLFFHLTALSSFFIVFVFIFITIF